MSQLIEVLVDIYPNHFNVGEKYCYANIRSAKVDEQQIVDNCISKMFAEDSPLLLDNLGFLPKNELNPIDIDRVCYLNIDKCQFEFKGEKSV